ncbi:MBL fold metallo-hydrolase [Polycladidibacter stylochi]|uniref:MBL fold metallo-hydrolase n=1 Tax=Polycladidibacter stylochi TaxID=1807766 RepID=UPI000AD1F134|nr:MBL fold metallo-hydrolase [Pseudovibrio stylochi]
MTYTVDMQQKPLVKDFFDPISNTISYVVQDPQSKSCAIIDSVMDIDYAAGRISFEHADEIIKYIKENELKLEWLIETHVHADHLSAAPYIQKQLGGKIGIGEHVKTVQEVFGKVFNAGTEFQRDGSQFDRLFQDGDSYEIGSLKAFAMHTPGHTPACMVHVIGDATFVGDTIFMPDSGTARADFPGGDAETLFESVQKVLSLPDEMRLFMCHDYAPGGREIMFETTVADEKKKNIHVAQGTDKQKFVQMRSERDATLDMPNLIVPSIQVNMRAGDLPDKENNGTVYLKVPVNVL